ncbi:drug/metabolite transporter (DMT)-like permease [Amorphus suaedae]
MTAAGRRSPAADNTAVAIATILFTVAALSFGDAVIKRVSTDFLLWQIFVLRSLLAIPLLVLIALRRGRAGLKALRLRSPAWSVVRSLLLVAMWVLYYAALPHLKLSIAASAYYTLPIFICLFSALLLGERVGRLGWAAIALGFVGVVLILDPSAGDFNAWVLLPLVSAILYALAMILTRTKCRYEHPLALSVTLNVTFVLVGVAGTLWGYLGGEGDGYLAGAWTPMGGMEWGAMAILTAAIIIGSVGAAIAYQLGRPSVIASYDFAYVGFAAVWGAIFFGELPDAQAAVGIALIVCAGLLAVRRRV